MLKYVVEEIDRVKGMYEDRLQRTMAQLDAARAADKQSQERLSAAKKREEQAVGGAQAAGRSLTELQQRLNALPQQLEVPA